MTMVYRQCKLRRGKCYKYAWLPSKYAVQGKMLRICDEDGWRVEEIYDAQSEEQVKARERAYDRWAHGRGLRSNTKVSGGLALDYE
ncbi:MAG: hypothetical protein DRN26_02425 [Thermoplasmata archaeon]|nr:MAG: hypothetical protein DRN26_02425 [Thermoplasmata archaeon]